MPIKIKKSSLKYKDSEGNMQDVGLPVGGVVTDATLTKSNVPADAKATGEKFNQLKANGVQQTPLFARDIKECTDKTKVYVLPDNYIYGYYDSDEDDNVTPPNTTYTITQGLKIDSSTGAESTGTDTYSASSFIEVVEGFTYTSTRASGNGTKALKVVYYDANKNFISTSDDVHAQDSNQVEETKEIPLFDDAKYIRLRLYGTATSMDPSIFVITATKKQEQKSGWCSTGLQFVTGDSIQRDFVQATIDALGVPIFGTVEADNTITVTGTLANGTYMFKYENDDGSVTDIGSFVV